MGLTPSQRELLVRVANESGGYLGLHKDNCTNWERTQKDVHELLDVGYLELLHDHDQSMRLSEEADLLLVEITPEGREALKLAPRT